MKRTQTWQDPGAGTHAATVVRRHWPEGWVAWLPPPAQTAVSGEAKTKNQEGPVLMESFGGKTEAKHVIWSLVLPPGLSTRISKWLFAAYPAET